MVRVQTVAKARARAKINAIAIDVDGRVIDLPDHTSEADAAWLVARLRASRWASRSFPRLAEMCANPETLERILVLGTLASRHAPPAPRRSRAWRQSEIARLVAEASQTKAPAA